MQNFGTKSLKYVVIDNFDLHIFQFNIDFVIFGSFLRFKFSKQPLHCFAYQWLDNVKINKPYSMQNLIYRGDGGNMIHFFKIFFSCFYDWIYLIALKCILHCQVLATT